MPTAFMLTGCTRGKRRTSTRACAKQIAPPTTASTDSKGTSCCNGAREITAMPARAHRVPMTAAAPRRSCRHSTASKSVARGTSASKIWPSPAWHLDEAVIAQPERAGEVEQAVQQRADQRPAARERQPQQRHDGQEHRSGERKSHAGTPQGRKLPVAEPDAHGIAAGKHGVRQECGERHPLAIRGGHERDATPHGLVGDHATVGDRTVASVPAADDELPAATRDHRGDDESGSSNHAQEHRFGGFSSMPAIRRFPRNSTDPIHKLSEPHDAIASRRSDNLR